MRRCCWIFLLLWGWPLTVATAIKLPRSLVLPQLNPVSGIVSSAFGWRLHPLLHTRQFHRGIDWQVALGTEVKSVTAGMVTFSGWRNGFGRLVILDHGAGWESWYAHLQTVQVKRGDRLQPGHGIGTVGASGSTTGPHLHFEMHYLNVAYDPSVL